ncbi:MAG: hypothetical protein C0616_02070 [Desulfuromonas sp.]|nr:MAG: hypothetical protein C0616_02070 [Desulfuromonas sp.]
MSEQQPTEQPENLVDIPFEQIDPQTLRRMIEEFVTADWSDFGDAHADLAGKVDQVLRQLRAGQAKVVFDVKTQSANIVSTR